MPGKYLEIQHVIMPMIPYTHEKFVEQNVYDIVSMRQSVQLFCICIKRSNRQMDERKLN